MKTLLSGNEAIAQGAWEAGVAVGAGYPGTPSTEILENLVRKAGVTAEWAPNEKVALEVGVGVSLAGARALVTMKHVGMNVASDALMTAAYTGVGGGLVIVVADDPGMHSSQNEQDSRRWGPFGKVVILEPSDSAEALEMAREAFSLSERLDMPVIVRTTTRIAHGKGLVEAGERTEPVRKPYTTRRDKWVMMPAGARGRRADLARRLEVARAESESSAFTRTDLRDTAIGIVTSGTAYQYVREALPEASTLKIGMSFPLPEDRIREFASSVDSLYVVEELDPYLADAIRAAGIEVTDTGLSRIGELSQAAVGRAFGVAAPPTREPMSDEVPPRPPMLCPGCPHRGVFAALRDMNAVVTGDIGCYTLGALAPLGAMDSCVCMGASIGMAHGFALGGGSAGKRPVVAVIGDSTFAHSGLTGLLNSVYNGGNETIVILDNRITAMTGHQDNPFTGRTLAGEPAPDVDIEAVVRALGVRDVRVVDPNLLRPTEKALRAAVETDGVSVVIAKAPCVLLTKEHGEPFAVTDACTACGFCINLGCPAISRDENSRATIDAALCVGCRQCVQVCRYGAIVRVGRTCEVKGE